MYSICNHVTELVKCEIPVSNAWYYIIERSESHEIFDFDHHHAIMKMKAVDLTSVIPRKTVNVPEREE